MHIYPMMSIDGVLTALGFQSVVNNSVTHGQCDAVMPDLWLPIQLQGIAAL